MRKEGLNGYSARIDYRGATHDMSHVLQKRRDIQYMPLINLVAWI